MRETSNSVRPEGPQLVVPSVPFSPSYSSRVLSLYRCHRGYFNVVGDYSLLEQVNCLLDPPPPFIEEIDALYLRKNLEQGQGHRER